MSEPTELNVVRVRHPLKIRRLQVVRVEELTPGLRRVVLSGDELAGFVSASFDDHVKVFFPQSGEDAPVLPTLGPDGLAYAANAPRPVVRDFTPRSFDAEAGELTIEFALHEAGPATNWAREARAGQYLGIAGPRGSRVIPTGFDWHLLVGDDTALPAIARRLQELPAATQAIAVIEVADAAAHVPLTSAAALRCVWCHRSKDAQASPLLDAVRTLRLPEGQGYAWAAGESGAIRAVRQHLIGERGLDKSRVHAAGYWKRGATDVHDHFDD